jgi:undecaprenyl diphosphate synthase
MQKDNDNLHVAIIMDGNGRWAQNRKKPRSYGHKIGSENVEKISEFAFSHGVKTLTLYAFSCENWARPKAEVDELMRLLKVYLKKFTKKLVKNQIRLSISGDVSAFSAELKEVILEGLEKTKNFDKNVLNLALNYGGRQEIVYAVNKLIKNGEEITTENISKELYTAEFNDPDLIIRTGGEIRLSNFMMFQSAYSELYFTDVLWPDFNGEELLKALNAFKNRNRRFGGL